MTLGKTALLTSAMALVMSAVLIYQMRNGEIISPASATAQATPALPKCGHWALINACKLQGVLLSLPEAMELLPTSETEHSFLDLKQALARHQIVVNGRRIPFEEFRRGKMPVIVQISEPNHFLVVRHPDAREIMTFDEFGTYTRMDEAEMQRRWTGNVLEFQYQGGAASFDNAQIKFDTLFNDVGVVPDGQDEIIVKFPFSNLGKQPLIVHDIKTTCSCVTAQKPKHPILPGQKDQIELTFHLGGKLPRFFQSVTVVTNSGEAPQIGLDTTGRIDHLLQISPERIEFGNCLSNKITSPRKVSLKYYGFDEFAIKSIVSTDKRVLARIIENDPADLGRGRSVAPNQDFQAIELECLIDGNAEPNSEIVAELRISTTSAKYREIAVPIHATMIPKIRAIPSSLILQQREWVIVIVDAEGDQIDLVDEPGVDRGFAVQKLSGGAGPLLKLNVSRSQDRDINSSLGIRVRSLSDNRIHELTLVTH